MSSSDDDDAASPLASSSDSAPSTSTAASSAANTSDVASQPAIRKTRSHLSSTSSSAAAAATHEAGSNAREGGSGRSAATGGADDDDDDDNDDSGGARDGRVGTDGGSNTGDATGGDKEDANSESEDAGKGPDAVTPTPSSHPLQRWANTKDRQHLLDCNMIAVTRDPHEVQHLECFFATFTNVSDVTSIFACLTSLRIMIAPQITSVAGVERCPQLTELWVCECGVDDISPIGSLAKLKEVHLYDNHIASVLPLANCKELVNVDVEHNNLRDLSVLGGLDRLEHINAAHNELSQLPSSFANLRHLHSLNVAGNQIADFSALVALRDVPTLRRLWLRSDDHSPNPVCHLANYHAWVSFLLPHLTLLDDMPAPSTKAKRRLSLQLEGKVVHTFSLRHSLRAAAWLWAHDYMKSVYTMRNHFIKDIQVRVAAVKAVLEREEEEQLALPEEEQEKLRTYLEYLSKQGARNDDFFESKTRALPTSHGLFEWRHNMLESFLRLIDTGYMHVHHSHLHPIDLSSVGTPQAQGAPRGAAWGASARQDVQAFFDRERFKQFGVVACRVHHILQVENAHLSRQHDMAVQKFLVRTQEEEQFASAPGRVATTACDGRITLGRLSARPGRNGQTSTTAAAVAAVSPTLARELTDRDVAFEYLMLDIGDARDDAEIDAAIGRMCSAPAGGSGEHRLTNRFHTLPHITSQLSSDHSWPPSHFTRVLVVRAYAPGLVWASARNGALSCLQASECVRRRRRHRAAKRSSQDPKHDQEQDQEQEQQQQQGRSRVSRASNGSNRSSTSTAPPAAPSNRSSRKATALRRRVAARARRGVQRRPLEETLCEGEDDSTAVSSDTEGRATPETAGGSGGSGGGGAAVTAADPLATESAGTNTTPASGVGKGAATATVTSTSSKRGSTTSTSSKGDDDDTDGQAEYTLPAGADVWFVPMYVMDVELCKNSLKLRPPKDDSSSSSTSVHVPESVHREWAQRKKLAAAAGGALNAALLPRLDADTRVFASVDFSSLTRLCLSGLGLQTVASLKGLPHLKHLNVGYNYLTSLAWTTALPALESLDVHHNRISSADVGGPCKLRFLDLGANSITRALALTGLPVVCPALQCLFLNDNPFLESDAVGVLHKLATKFADMRLITLEWSVVYRTSPLWETSLPPALEIRVSPFFKGEDRHVCAVWPSSDTAAADARALSAQRTAAEHGAERKGSDAEEGDGGACGATFACMHGSAPASYGGAPPWHSYRICQELVVCNDCTDVGMLSRLAPPGVTQLRRPSVMNIAGFQTLQGYVEEVRPPEQVKGILVRASGPSTRPIIQDGVADFSARATKNNQDAFQHVEWLALDSCRLTTFRLPPRWSETLTSLSLVDNALGSLKFVQALPSLRYLDVGHNEVQSLEDVASLAQLKTLLLSFNFVHDLSPLQSLQRLTTLYIDHNCISNPREVFHLRELKALRVLNVAANAFCRKRSVVPFVLFYLSGRLTMLNDRLVTRADLDFAKRQFEGVLTVDVIADNVGEQQCEFVRTLDLPHCALREARLSDEMRFEHLYSLNLEDNAMTTLEPLAGLKFLRVLCLNKNRIRKYSSHRPRSADLHASTAFSSVSAASAAAGISFSGGGSTLVRDAQGRLVRTNLSRNQGMSRSTSSIPNTFSSSSVPSSIATRAPGSPGVSRRGLEGAAPASKAGAMTARRNAHLDRALSPSRERASSTGNTATTAATTAVGVAGRTGSPLPRAKRGAVTPPPQRRRAQSPLVARRRPPAARQRGTNTNNNNTNNTNSNNSGGVGVRGADAAPYQQQQQRQRQFVDGTRSTSVAGRSTDDATAFPSLEVLMLADNGIHKLGPLMLHRFPKLHTLFLQSNDISSTAGLADMPALTALILDHNRIKTIAKDTLSTCPKLRDLHVNSNRLQEVDQLSSNTQLQRVYMQSNRLAALEDLSGLKPHRRLRELVVADNPFSRRRDSRLEIVHFLPQVVVLDLAPVTRAERQEALVMFSTPEDMLDPLAQSEQQQVQQQQSVHKPIARKSSLPAIQQPPQQQQPQLALTPQTLSFMSETLGTASTQQAPHLQRHSSRGNSHTPMSASVLVAEERKQRRFGGRDRGGRASSSSKRGRLSKIQPSLSRNHLPIKLRPLDKQPPRS